MGLGDREARVQGFYKASMSQGAPEQMLKWAMSFVLPNARLGLVEGLPGHYYSLPPFPLE